MQTATKVRSSEYWIGILPGAPIQRVAVRGVTFQLYTEKVSHPRGAIQTKRSERPGQVRMIDDQIAGLIKKDLKIKVLRMLGKYRPEVRDPRAKAKNPRKRFVPHETDRLLGEFVYMVPTEEAASMHMRGEIPPSFVEMTDPKREENRPNQDNNK